MGERLNRTPTISEIMDKQCPFYMSIGMSREEYWHGDPMLVKDYLEAFNQASRRKYDEMNFMAWLQGAYISNAVTVGVAYALDGKAARSRAVSYLDEPLDIFGDKSSAEKSKAEKEKAEEESVKWIMNIYRDTNARFNGEG